MTQQYLITVQCMSTCDEADLVSGWSAVVAEENLGNISLPSAAEASRLAIRDFPGTNIRPMSDAEIAAWRSDERE